MRSNGESNSGGEALLAGAIAAIVVVFDQLSKAWAVEALDAGQIVVIDGILNLRLFFNTGASFSLFAKGGAIIGLVVIGVVVMIFFALREAGHRLDAVALGLVLGGAVGNLLDRMFRGDGFLDGAVVDFINVPFFATFNIADIAINVGVGLLLLGAFLRR